ncbi:hypothetical protein CC1G_09756 [Coprinopsis cinerea okayama7|uniref:SUN domain-containing protein n=1 Tax=Coprinopsis cinerea (strain Okayama-7 / 130 / ATCC MYA-4618 / FGSC 9003) TaxID=240176 RepID=A8PE15_COPC7|nr:hypothetical protein CC1G_09756 [Coprinopsis cinerea okayama7\|eukprot:XP_001840705.2 hypothetical protein CC1G_09756 [Coprinopsis cinerea okayama7\
MAPPRAKARKWYNIHEEPQAGIGISLTPFSPDDSIQVAPCRYIRSSSQPLAVGASAHGTSWVKTGFIWLFTIFFTAFQTWCCTFAVSTVLYKFGCTPEGSTTVCIPLEILPGFGPFFRLQHRLAQMSGKIDDMQYKLSRLEDQLPLDFHNRDFALWGLGAQVIPELTSRDEGDANAVLPSAVLDDPPLLGECWEFMGRRGQIGIQLSDAANITAMSLSQPFDESVLVPLVHAHYNATSPQSRQIFAVTSPVAKVVRFDIVVVEVLDNWGGESTCLYHIGVHGLED